MGRAGLRDLPRSAGGCAVGRWPVASQTLPGTPCTHPSLVCHGTGLRLESCVPLLQEDTEIKAEAHLRGPPVDMDSAFDPAAAAAAAAKAQVGRARPGAACALTYVRVIAPAQPTGASARLGRA